MNKALQVLVIFLMTAIPAVGADNVAEVFKRHFPNVQDPVIRQSPIQGLYEVTSGVNILYFDPVTKYILVGDILDNTGKSLTVPQRNAAAKRYLESKRSAAIKIGQGKTVVYEITDPDCPYCRKMHGFWENRSDVTRYVFLTALPMHSNSSAKINHIFDSKDRQAAIKEVFSGKYDLTIPAVRQQNHMATKNMEVAKHVRGGTPQYWINGQYVNGADTEAITKILDRKE